MLMAKHAKRGFRRVFNAAPYSCAGLAWAWRKENAYRQEVLLVAIFVPVGAALGNSGVQRGLLIGCVLLVLVVELLNSAIEAVVDRVSGDQHELADEAKDLGSAAVFVALVNVVMVWSLVLWDR